MHARFVEFASGELHRDRGSREPGRTRHGAYPLVCMVIKAPRPALTVPNAFDGHQQVVGVIVAGEIHSESARGLAYRSFAAGLLRRLGEMAVGLQTTHVLEVAGTSQGAFNHVGYFRVARKQRAQPVAHERFVTPHGRVVMHDRGLSHRVRRPQSASLAVARGPDVLSKKVVRVEIDGMKERS